MATNPFQELNDKIKTGHSDKRLSAIPSDLDQNFFFDKMLQNCQTNTQTNTKLQFLRQQN